ncbi:MAG: alpha-amylase family protein [Armatimonadota bacterium]
MKPTQFPLRHIHLDFHTSPDIPDVGADWDADLFARTLADAHVQSINVFAKCHHGMNYYPSKIAPVHPALQFDMLGEMIEACHKVGIHAPIYVSVGWEMSAAERHPEWRQMDKDGKLVGRGPFDNGWGWPWMCYNENGYAEELYAQVDELFDLYGDAVDGFWFDIIMYHPDGCLCPKCFDEIRQAGQDPQDVNVRNAHNNDVQRRFMDKMTQLIRGRKADAGIFYNGRMGLPIEDEVQYFTQVEIESLPTGGWGYGFYPLWSRFARNLGLPMLGMTGRFHRGWADWGGLKHPDALRFECGGILASGGAICVGDQMHPRGRLNKTIYKMIGEAFRDVEAVEEYCYDAIGVAQIGLLTLEGARDNMDTIGKGGPLEGGSKMLLEQHQQFDVITARCEDFGQYDLLIIPDTGALQPQDITRLKTFVANGGKLIVSNEGLLDQSAGNFQLADEMGVDYVGPCESNPDYFEITDPALFGPVTQPEFSYSLYVGPGSRVKPRPGTQVLADAHATYFNRTWEHFSSHGFTPPLAQKADYPAITRNGNVIYLHGSIFTAYQQFGNLTFRDLVGKCINLLLTEPLVTTDAPSTAEVSLTRQGTRDIVHMVNYHACRRATQHVEALEPPVPLYNVQLSLRKAGVTSVKLARASQSVPFTQDGDVVTVTIPKVEIHELVIFE